MVTLHCLNQMHHFTHLLILSIPSSSTFIYLILWRRKWNSQILQLSHQLFFQDVTLLHDLFSSIFKCHIFILLASYNHHLWIYLLLCALSPFFFLTHECSPQILVYHFNSSFPVCPVNDSTSYNLLLSSVSSVSSFFFCTVLSSSLQYHFPPTLQPPQKSLKHW